MLLDYLKCKIKFILLFMCFVGIFVLIEVLYNMPSDAVEYAILLCSFVALMFLLYDYCKYCGKKKILIEMKKSIELSIDDLPRTSNGIEEQYQNLIKELFDKKALVVSKSDNDMSNMVDYYSMWAHQIKTPISAMKLILQSDETEENGQLLLELLKIEQYVEMVLQYLRLKSDSTDFVIKTQDLDEIVKQAVKKCSTIFIKKKIKLEYEPLDCKIISDEKWMVFVVEQVLTNALKYTNRGTISIFMDKESKKTLVIEDTGIGIQMEDLPRVFEKGFTGYNGRINKKSTGIGLYLCKSILEKLGHTINIESEVDKGSKVKIGLTSIDLKVE